MPAKKTPKKTAKQSGFAAVAWDYGKAVALAVLLALFVRSFIVQAFQIPSGSMIPTFLEGDRVLVNKFAYGVRNPFTNTVWFDGGRPERGDVVVFIYPQNPDQDFVKRVIGLPGERVALKNGLLYINGQPTPDTRAHYDHNDPDTRDFPEVAVPPDAYLMMGDNRDNSNDSRFWGPVHFSLLRGKAWRLYWSWDSQSPDKSFFDRLRTERLGRKIE